MSSGSAKGQETLGQYVLRGVHVRASGIAAGETGEPVSGRSVRLGRPTAARALLGGVRRWHNDQLTAGALSLVLELPARFPRRHVEERAIEPGLLSNV